jgi:hypothetical protein
MFAMISFNCDTDVRRCGARALCFFNCVAGICDPYGTSVSTTDATAANTFVYARTIFSNRSSFRDSRFVHGALHVGHDCFLSNSVFAHAAQK